MDADVSVTMPQPSNEAVTCPTCRLRAATVVTPIGPRCMACIGLVAVRHARKYRHYKRSPLDNRGRQASPNRTLVLMAQGRAYLAARDAE